MIAFENADCDDYISEKFFRNIQVSDTQVLSFFIYNLVVCSIIKEYNK